MLYDANITVRVPHSVAPETIKGMFRDAAPMSSSKNDLMGLQAARRGDAAWGQADFMFATRERGLWVDELL